MAYFLPSPLSTKQVGPPVTPALDQTQGLALVKTNFDGALLHQS
jgi:hypothetical protein